MMGNTNSLNSGYKTGAFKAPLPSLGEGLGVRAKCSGEVQIWYKWHIPLWLSVCCLLAACGSGTPDTQPSVSEPAPAPATTVATPPESLPAEVSPQSRASDPAALADTTVIPGERVGPVTGATSRAELADLYGEAALEDTEIPVGEGFTESGTTVNAGTEQAFSVIWVDESQSQPATVKDFGTAWQTPEGIRVGTSFAELQALLGTFDLYGFAWDYQGTVVLEGSNLADYYGELILRLNPDQAAIEAHPEAYQAVQGDQLFSADNPNLPVLDLVVDEMIVYLNPPVQ